MEARSALLEQRQQEERGHRHEQQRGDAPGPAVAAVLVAAAVLHEHAERAGPAHAVGAFLLVPQPAAVAHRAEVAVHFLDDLSAHLRPGACRQVVLDAHVAVHEVGRDVVERVGAVRVVGRVAAPAVDGPAFVHKHQREENNSYEGHLRTAGGGHRSGAEQIRGKVSQQQTTASPVQRSSAKRSKRVQRSYVVHRLHSVYVQGESTRPLCTTRK